MMARNAWRGVGSSVVATIRMRMKPLAMDLRLGPWPGLMARRIAHRTRRKFTKMKPITMNPIVASATKKLPLAVRSRYWNTPFAYLHRPQGA